MGRFREPGAKASVDEAPQVFGRVASGFEVVRDVFATNFVLHQEIGASFAASINGQLVVDLWAGVADMSELKSRRYESDTLQVIFSGTKALVALCLLMLVDRDQLDLSAPVCIYWPEFAAGGKESIRVIDLAAHRARLPGFLVPVSEDELIDDTRMAELLAAQPCEDDPRASDIYHALTYGWLCGEVVRRIDGRSVGRFFAEEVARPLGLEVWIGLPNSLEERVATLYYGSELPWWDDEALAADDLINRVWNNPALFPADHLPWNRTDWHEAEIPGAGGIATARSIARLYDCLARGGELDGTRLLSAKTLAMGCHEVTRRWEPILGESQVIATGFQLQAERLVFGPPLDAFGHAGAGGSVHCAWPSQQVGISYAMNALINDETDPRANALLAALYQTVMA